MRILIVSQRFWPETFRINQLAAKLHRSGHSVQVLCGVPHYPEGKVFPGYHATSVSKEVHPEGYDVYRVPEFPRGRRGAWRLALNYLSFAISSTLLAPFLLRKLRYDVIFVYATSPIFQAIAGIVLKRLTRARLVIWVQDLWPDSLSSTGYIRNTKILNTVGRFVDAIHKSADLLLGQSEGLVRTLKSRLGRQANVDFLPNPGEELENSNSVPRVMPLPPGYNVLFAGNMGTAQDLDVIVAAAKRLAHSSINIVMAGSGSRADWMKDEVKSLGIHNIYFLGRLPAEDMPEVFKAASALLITLSDSPNYNLIIPSKLQSYLAAGRPIVGALNGEGAAVIAEANAGIVVSAGDSTGLASAIENLASLPSSAQRDMAENGLRYYRQHYSLAAVSDRLVQLLENS